MILPFFILAFLEALALELIYFSARKPIANIAAPIIKKFAGEGFLHYPNNLLKLPTLFYYAQIIIYIVCGVFLIGISIKIYENVKLGHALRVNALISNAVSHYLSFFIFGVIIAISMHYLRKIDAFIFYNVMGAISGYLPPIVLKWPSVIFTLFAFFTNIALQALLFLTLPLIVIKKESLFKALSGSIVLGLRNFFSIFILIFLPFLVYLPIALLKTASLKLMERSFPEVVLGIAALGILVSIFLNCFIYGCAAQFLLDVKKAEAKA